MISMIDKLRHWLCLCSLIIKNGFYTICKTGHKFCRIVGISDHVWNYKWLMTNIIEAF